MKHKISFSVILAVSMALFLLPACQAKIVSSEEPSTLSAVASPTPQKAEPITIAAVGDIMLGSPFPDDTRMPPNDGADLLKNVTPILSAADIAFGNLEGPMVDGGISAKCPPPSPTPTPPATSKPVTRPNLCFAFRSPTRYGKYLKDAGFDIMSLANNHAGDFGDSGRVSTQRVLDSLGIKHAGSDKDQFSTAILEVKGKKVAVVGFAHNKITPNVNDLVTARRLVTAAAKTADIVIVSFHGGAEGVKYQHVPNAPEIYAGEARGNLPAFAHAVIDAGADLVLGHGPHVLRGMEIYKDRLIAYSLGNFCTYGWFKLEAETALTAIVEATLAPDGKFIRGKIHNARQQGRGIPALDSSGESIRKIKNLSIADFGTNAPTISDDGTITPK